MEDAMRCALLDPTGLVTNVILAGPGFDPGDGLTLVEISDDSPVDLGWTYAAGEWTAGDPPTPEPPPPSVASLIQAQVDELTDLTVEMLDLLMGM